MNDSWTRLAILLAFAATLLGQVVIVHEETRKPNTILFLVDDTRIRVTSFPFVVQIARL
jgi:hypothetical protein